MVGDLPIATSPYKVPCPQGLDGNEGENDRPINRTDIHGLNESERLWTCVCQKGFKTERGMKIHRTKMRCTEVHENRSTGDTGHKADGILPRVENHSGQTTSSQTPSEHHGGCGEKQQIDWPKMNSVKLWHEFDEYAVVALNSALTGGGVSRARQLPAILYSICEEKFGLVEKRDGTQCIQLPNRRQCEKGKLRTQQRALRERLRNSAETEKQGILVLLDDVRERLQKLARAEALRKKRKARRKSLNSFMKNPYGFAKKLFEQSKNGELKASQAEVEAHLAEVYGNKNDVCMDIPGLKRPASPGYSFEMGDIKLNEVMQVVTKARAKSAPGMNGISYKLYKKCPGIVEVLTKVLNQIWRSGRIPDEWCCANGVYIPKEDKAENLGQFRPISLLNVEGKIFFSVLAKRLTDYLMNNGFIDPSVQKAGIPGFPGCLEHVSMIWSAIKSAKKSKSNLEVVWLDLANAYGSVPHSVIDFALSHYWVPDRLRKMVECYYEKFKMRFTTKNFTTSWQELAVGIPMGCAISPLLFVMVMEMVIQSSQDCVRGVQAAENQILPPMRAFMDDITIISPKKAEVEASIARLHELIDRCAMRFKPSKSRSLSLCKGKAVPNSYFIGNERIPTLAEQPVKSLGRWYCLPITDRFRGSEVKKQLSAGLDAIEKCGLFGKYKAWILNFALMPRILWPLTVYDIPLTPVERMEQMINKKLRKWLGVPMSFNTNALYATSFTLSMPMKSLVEEYKTSKARLDMMLSESPDQVIRDCAPTLDTGRKWSVTETVGDAKSRLEINEIVGAVTTARHGVGWEKSRWFSKESPQVRREMVVDEVRKMEEERRNAQAVGQAQQGRWTCWETVEQRQLKWSDLWCMEPQRISFLLCSSYDQLPTPANLERWNQTSDSRCGECQAKGTLRHILSNCPMSLGRYTWRHNQVLKVFCKYVTEKCEYANAGGENKDKIVRKKGLGNSAEWKVRCDLTDQLSMPQHIVITNQRPDLIIWSDIEKTIILMELTVPWEENLSYAHERKLSRYDDLVAQCQARGWNCELFAVEVGCRGFSAQSALKFLTRVGLSGRELKQATKSIVHEAESASAWIWQQHCAKVRTA